ncbi:MAG TPA: L,D-transpeptidase [Mycobacteriales bacterium]|nr:L,D-transpeptidase [Mycobacteriales bacterium]
MPRNPDVPPLDRPIRSRRLAAFAGTVALVLALIGVGTCYLMARPSGEFHSVAKPSPKPILPSIPPAAPAPVNLPVVDYDHAPAGFPADPTPASTNWLTTGLRPLTRVAAYDAVGGKPLAFLPPDIRGAELTAPITETRDGWVSVLLPSTNRTVAWVPPGNWTTVPLQDELIVVRKTHQLTWLRNGTMVASWEVSLGLPRSPTPLGRTFVLGRSKLKGHVYANTDVFALGAVPDNPGAIPKGLLGAHTGIHTWYHDRELGENTTDGCIRLTKSGQQQLLAEIMPGTSVIIVDRLPAPAHGPAAMPTAG